MNSPLLSLKPLSTFKTFKKYLQSNEEKFTWVTPYTHTHTHTHIISYLIAFISRLTGISFTTFLYPIFLNTQLLLHKNKKYFSSFSIFIGLHNYNKNHNWNKQVWE